MTCLLCKKIIYLYFLNINFFVELYQFNVNKITFLNENINHSIFCWVVVFSPNIIVPNFSFQISTMKWNIEICKMLIKEEYVNSMGY
jgi:hypothetical protein